jgi:iron uptake system component EfeO
VTFFWMKYVGPGLFRSRQGRPKNILRPAWNSGINPRQKESCADARGKTANFSGAGAMKIRSLPVALVVVLCLCGSLAKARGTESSRRVIPLESAAGAFRAYVLEQLDQSVAGARMMRDRIAAHDLEGAQRAWLAARGGWEASEVVTAEYFPDLDRAIDGWPDAARGFHAIEAQLFGAHTTDALPAADELLGNLMEFQRQLQSTTLTAQRLLNGVTRLTYEIGEDKAGGGESPFSGNSLAEIGSNVSAIAAVYHRVLAPTAKEKKPEFSVRIAAELDRLNALVAAPSLRELDQTALRELSEILTDDLAGLGQLLGLERPSLGN